MDEKTLVGAVQSGDRSAFDLLVRLHYRSVYGLAFRFMNDHGGADEVVQETFIKAFHAIGSFRGESSFKSWVLRIASNTAKNALRSRNRHEAVDLENVQIPQTHRDFTRMEDLQTSGLLKLAIEKLSTKQKQALELRIFENLSFKEIAEIMECPFDTAKANFRHALLNLKKILDTYEGGKGIEEMKLAFESVSEDDL